MYINNCTYTIFRCGTFEVNTSMLSSLDESTMDISYTDLSSDEQPMCHSQEMSSEQEWETVTGGDSDMPSYASEMYATGNPTNTPVYASTLMSSAAASVANMWRGAW